MDNALDSSLSRISTELSSLSIPELQQHCDDDDKLDTFIKSSYAMQSSAASRESLLESNRMIAQHNLENKLPIKTLKSELIEKYNTLDEEKQKFAIKMSQYEEKKSKNTNTLDSCYAVLQAKSAEAEESSESVAEQLLQGSVTMEEFLVQFIPLRTVSHKRRIQCEKMAELIRKMPAEPTPSAATTTAAPPIHHQTAPLTYGSSSGATVSATSAASTSTPFYHVSNGAPPGAYAFGGARGQSPYGPAAPYGPSYGAPPPAATGQYGFAANYGPPPTQAAYGQPWNPHTPWVTNK